MFGDVIPELDETFRLQLSNAPAGIIQRPVGRGLIGADDLILLQLDAADGPSDVRVLLDNENVLISQDGTVLVDGPLSADAPLWIQTPVGGETAVTLQFSDSAPGDRNIQLISQGSCSSRWSAGFRLPDGFH